MKDERRQKKKNEKRRKTKEEWTKKEKGHAMRTVCTWVP